MSCPGVSVLLKALCWPGYPKKPGKKAHLWLQGLPPGVWFQGSLSETGEEESQWDDVLLSGCDPSIVAAGF